MQTNEPAPKPRPFRVRHARDLGAAIKYFRTLAGVTQVELAERTGIHRSYLAALETGHSTEALERLMILLGELGVRITIVQVD
jgi:transcriptional regulator with XRE-family HTH domain